ncbi:MAG TPA: NAD(P)/FAD-dependent oxidoreductase [Thermoanaerobaculia bacterium]|nr:NAD(P)/FAD-dependent oxidoreductase [Thermoanaerobaculia bacterium]
MYQIGIVGGGIAGTAAAVHLARGGHRVTLFERAPVLGPVGAGILLQPSGQEALATLGLLEAVTAKSEPIAELRADQVSGRRLIRLPYRAADPAWTGYGVARGLLFRTLLDACRAAGIEIVTGVAIEKRENTPESSFLIDRDGVRHGPFDFVIGADGSRSALRRASGLDGGSREYDFGALWAMGPCAAVTGHLYQVVRGTKVLIGILPLGGGRASLFWGDRKDGIDAIRKGNFAAFREKVLALAPKAEEIFSEFQSFDQAAFTTYVHVACPRWSAERLLLIGDAAHAMSPHLGQGANLALADAEMFARLLAQTGDFSEACTRFEAERRPPALYLSHLSYLLTPFFQSGSRILGLGRDVALPILTAIPPIRRLMARTLAGKVRGLPWG